MLLVIFGHIVLDLFGILVLSLFVALFEALAGGSGITPVLSLLRQCREECRASFAKPNAKHDLIKEFSIIHAMRSMDERPLSYELDYRGPDGQSRPVIDREREDRSDRSGIPRCSYSLKPHDDMFGWLAFVWLFYAVALRPLRLETTWYNPLAETGLAPHCTVTHLATGQKEQTLKRSMSHREGKESIGIASQCVSFLRSGDISGILRIQGIPGQSNMLNNFEGFGVWLSFVPLLVQGWHTTMAS